MNLQRVAYSSSCRNLIAGRVGAAVAIAAFCAIATPAHADPSFDCAQASVPAEQAICDIPSLAKLDQQIADVYFALLEAVRPTQAAQVRHQQRAFLRERNECAIDGDPNALASCIDEAMRARLVDLQMLHADVTGAPLVSGGDMTTAAGIWRASRPGEISPDAFRHADGSAVCIVGLPDRPVVGTISDNDSGCRVADHGSTTMDPAFSVLIPTVAVAWSPVATVTSVPENAVEAWSDGNNRVQICSATMDGQQITGTLHPGKACVVLFEPSSGGTEELLILAGFEVLTTAE